MAGKILVSFVIFCAVSNAAFADNDGSGSEWSHKHTENNLLAGQQGENAFHPKTFTYSVGKLRFLFVIHHTAESLWIKKINADSGVADARWSGDERGIPIPGSKIADDRLDIEGRCYTYSLELIKGYVYISFLSFVDWRYSMKLARVILHDSVESVGVVEGLDQTFGDGGVVTVDDGNVGGESKPDMTIYSDGTYGGPPTHALIVYLNNRQDNILLARINLADTSDITLTSAVTSDKGLYRPKIAHIDNNDYTMDLIVFSERTGDNFSLKVKIGITTGDTFLVEDLRLQDPNDYDTYSLITNARIQQHVISVVYVLYERITGQNNRQVVIRGVTENGKVFPPKDADPFIVDISGGSQAYARFSSDSESTSPFDAFISYSKDRSIYLQKVKMDSNSMSISVSDGWLTTGVKVSPDGSDALYSTFSKKLSGNGEVLLTWTDLSGKTVRAQRVLGRSLQWEGGRFISSRGTSIGKSSVSAVQIRSMSGSEIRYFVGWEDNRGQNNSIYGAMINHRGNLGGEIPPASSISVRHDPDSASNKIEFTYGPAPSHEVTDFVISRSPANGDLDLKEKGSTTERFFIDSDIEDGNKEYIYGVAARLQEAQSLVLKSSKVTTASVFDPVMTAVAVSPTEVEVKLQSFSTIADQYIIQMNLDGFQPTTVDSGTISRQMTVTRIIGSLIPSTTYLVSAYVFSSSAFLQSNTVSVEVATPSATISEQPEDGLMNHSFLKDSKRKSSSCYIATAAMGSEKDVVVLQLASYRDGVEGSLFRAIFSLYKYMSPEIIPAVRYGSFTISMVKIVIRQMIMLIRSTCAIIFMIIVLIVAACRVIGNIKSCG